MARQIRRSPSIALLLVSSSYVTLAYHTHPFSNTSETAILALCATLLARIIRDHESSVSVPGTCKSPLTSAPPVLETSVRTRVAPSISTDSKPTRTHLSFGLGVLFSIGIFTRITFVLYAFPLGVMFLYLNFKASFKQDRSILAGMVTFFLACVPLALGLVLMSALCIFIDSVYFRHIIIYNTVNGMQLSFRQILKMAPQDWLRLSYKGSLTLTMLNNLRYNLDEKNLAQHGLHLLLNFPILFGNLAFIGVATLIQKARKRMWRSDSLLVTVNCAMAIVFGLLHQAGLVPAMDIVQHQALGFQNCQEISSVQHVGDHMSCVTYPTEKGRFHVDDGMSYTTHVVFYKTYMPPHHLFGFNSEIAQARGVALKISDWREKSRAQLLVDLDVGVESQGSSRVDRTLLKIAREQEIRGQRAVLYRKTGLAQFERTILIAPSTVNFTNEDFYETRDRIPRHANFDHIQVMVQQPLRSFDLNVYYL
ncbi:alpha 1,2 mannosyltransferase [Mortierella polycephala]|uniref:Mannosyltransferase n=1 Tax=Mortierella polycephala TaxID=41804 RepID=A0A9P6PPI5_9FUNG|nr:alpha 1,2 mannosyltransferase [Mortierella polycephala]